MEHWKGFIFQLSLQTAYIWTEEKIFLYNEIMLLVMSLSLNFSIQLPH